MDVQRHDDGRWHFSLGVVEKWIVGVGAVGLFAMISFFANSFDARLSRNQASIDTLITQQAVMNAHLLTLNAQLADVPGLSRQMAEIRVQVDQNREDIRELRATRNLR